MKSDVLAGLVTKLAAGEDGAAASEYAITVAGVAATIAAALSDFELKGLFTAVIAKVAGLIG